MKKGLNEIIMIMDNSGSMSSVRDDAIGGYNSFLEEQRKDIDCETNITTILFNTEKEVICENQDVHKALPLNDSIYRTHGMTALLDTIGSTIDSVGKRLANTPEDNRPEKVIVCIQTDGCENSSREYTREKIKEMIEHQKEKYQWEFIYMGANQDSFTEAGSIGIDQVNITNYIHDSVGTRSAYASMTMDSMLFKAKV